MKDLMDLQRDDSLIGLINSILSGSRDKGGPFLHTFTGPSARFEGEAS